MHPTEEIKFLDNLVLEKNAEIDQKNAEIKRLRAALEAWNAAVRKDVLMEGPRYMGVDLTRGRHAWELTKAALKETNDK
jgi:hypothetical protein